MPLLYPSLFNSSGQPTPWRKLLLYGPPGVGKTMLAQAISNEFHSLFTIFQVSLADITSKFVGESEKLNILNPLFLRMKTASVNY